MAGEDEDGTVHAHHVNTTAGCYTHLMAQLPTAAQVQARLHPELEQELPGVRARLAHVDDTIQGK
jgi:hypothetical protein